jgi:hypothetical protein
MLKKLCFGLLICSLMAVILADCGTGQGSTPTGTPTPTVQATATTSGTASATPTPSAGPSQPINEIWMSDATTGWASTTTHLILHTIDGGKSWQNVTPPYPADSTVEVPPVFTFLNGTVAWVATFEKQQPDGSIPTWFFAPAMVGTAGSRPCCPIVA